MRLLLQAKSFFLQRPFLIFLLILLTIISLSTFHPNHFIIGWDNFSSYFNLKENLLRTFFAGWRGYRGLGVPSDSENVDIFRQVFYALLKPFLPMYVWEQVYVLTCLIAGVIAMYIFVEQLLRRTIYEKNLKPNLLDLGAGIAAFFYLFNLNTISTFYFPMVMFVHRFFALPVLFLIFLKLADPVRSKKKLLGLILLLIATSTTYLVATLFITTIIALGIFMLNYSGVRKTPRLITIYTLLMSFWLLPFVNYTLQKSPIISRAPTFIDTNEIQLNRPKEFFSLGRQLRLYPNFFDTTYTRLSDGKVTAFASLAQKLHGQPFLLISYIFPILWIFGLGVILLKYRKRGLLWIPVMMGVFLFLSLKEYSPLGSLYTFLDNVIPYFKIIFRFGDTKFHAYMAFAGSIAAGVGVYRSVEVWKYGKIEGWRDRNVESVESVGSMEGWKKEVLGLLKFRPEWLLHLDKFRRAFILILLLSTLVMFRTAFTKGIVGDFMFNRIPSAYFEIARVINNDPRDVRVLHLPMDTGGYWKSYHWGALGSSFFHFMLNKPLIDRTFEPASMENAYLDNHIRKLIDNVQALSEEGLRERSAQLSTLLDKAGVGYIIMDETVSSYIPSRDMLLWGRYSGPDAKKLTNTLKQYGYAQSIQTYDIEGKTVEVLKMSQTMPKFSFVQQAEKIDPGFDTFLQSSKVLNRQTFLQSSSTGIISPFLRLNGLIEQGELIFPDTQLARGSYKVRKNLPKSLTSDHVTSAVHILIARADTKLSVDLFAVQLPQIGEATYEEHVVTVQFSLPGDTGQMLLKVGDTVLDMPENEQDLGVVMVKGDTVPVSLMSLQSTRPIESSDFRLTDNPNCFNDAGEGYEYTFNNDQTFNLRSHAGTTCIIANLAEDATEQADHARLKLDYTAATTRLSGETHDFTYLAKPKLARTLYNNPAPTNISVCLRQVNFDQCLNTYKHASLSDAGTLVFDVPAQDPSQLLALIGLRTQEGAEHSLQFQNMQLQSFKKVASQEVVFEPQKDVEAVLQVGADQTLRINLPFIKSPYAANFQKDALLSTQAPCGGGLRFLRGTQAGALYSYLSSCQNDLSYELPFDSDNLYLWTVNMNLLAGKYPKFVLTDQFNMYQDEYVGLYQGYPFISGFKKFEESESLFTGNVDNKLANAQTRVFYTMLYQQSGLNDTKQKNFTLHQDTENEGGLLLTDMRILPLPNTWQYVDIIPEKNVENFSQATVMGARQILPSLWKVTTKGSNASGPHLLRFNEAFDTQWGMYASLWDVFIGRKLDYELWKCDGFAQCYAISDMPNSVYLFYSPERLSWIGWGITIIVALASLALLVRGVGPSIKTEQRAEQYDF